MEHSRDNSFATWSLDPSHEDRRLLDPALFEGIRTKRVLAYLVDALIIGLMIAALWVVAIGPVLLSFGLLQPLVWAATALLPFAYHTLLIGGAGHATLGMRLMGLRAIGTDGTGPGLMQAAVLTGVFLVTAALTQFLILFVSFVSERGRTLHDYVAGVVVIAADPSR